MLYAKIFLQQNSQSFSSNIVNSQSLFCFNSGFDQLEKSPNSKDWEEALKTPQRKQREPQQFLTPNEGGGKHNYPTMDLKGLESSQQS